MPAPALVSGLDCPRRGGELLSVGFVDEREATHAAPASGHTFVECPCRPHTRHSRLTSPPMPPPGLGVLAPNALLATSLRCAACMSRLPRVLALQNPDLLRQARRLRGLPAWSGRA